MSIEVYSPDFSQRKPITHATALQMQAPYNSIGKFQLTLPISESNIENIVENAVIYDTTSEFNYTIQNVSKNTENNTITARGYTTNWLLNKRSIISRLAVKNVEQDLYAAVNANLRALPRVKTAPAKGIKAQSDAVLFGKQLLDGVMEVLKEADCGNRMLWDDEAKQFIFEIYQGKDLTPAAAGIHAVIFSEARGSAKNLISESDSSTLKNYFYIPCKLADKTEIIVEYGDPAIPDRREYWIASSLTQGKDETKEQLIKRAQQKCREEAAKRLKRQNFNVTIKPEELGARFDIGDKISCVSERLGISFDARINGVTYQMDKNGTQTKINLGEPSLTALGEVMLNG